jgi:[ribosomal protein S18]-alanine N-acetyltransferase
VSVRIRPLLGRDLPEVFAIEQKVFPEDAWTDAMFASELAELARYGTRYYVVAEADDVVVGYAGLSTAGGDQGDVQTIAVRTDRQGEGIGTALLADLIAAAESRGCRELFLDVRSDNARAQRLYRLTGFTDIGIRRGYYQPSGTDAIVMCLQLPRRANIVGPGGHPVSRGTPPQPSPADTPGPPMARRPQIPPGGQVPGD